MCGRIVRTSPAEALAAEFGATPPAEADLRPRWNLCPGEDLLIVVQKGEERRMGTVRWGFLPLFARDAHDGPRSINARSESVATRPAFRDAFRRHRCLVAADGFYEWRREGRTRRPFFVRLRSHRPMAPAGLWGRGGAAPAGLSFPRRRPPRPMALAGLWDRWRPPDGEPLLTGLVITCPARGRLARIHDRMPVILERDAAGP